MQREHRGKDALKAPVLTFDLNEQVDKLRAEKPHGKEKQTGITLVKNEQVRVVLMSLPAGTALSEHQSEGPITVQLLSGSVSFTMGAERLELRAGSFLTLAGSIPHTVEASEDSALLLTVVPATSS